MQGSVRLSDRLGKLVCPNKAFPPKQGTHKVTPPCANSGIDNGMGIIPSRELHGDTLYCSDIQPH